MADVPLSGSNCVPCDAHEESTAKLTCIAPSSVTSIAKFSEKTVVTLEAPLTELTSRADISEEWMIALVSRDTALCHALAIRAGMQRDTTAVPALCKLAGMQPDGWQRLAGHRKAWRWARVAAIDALSRLGAMEALPVLTVALSDPDPHVREAAAFEIPTFGVRAVPTLRLALCEVSDWSLPGMQALIRILGYLGDSAAAAELIHVLDEQLPGDPYRWTRYTFARPLCLVALLFTGLWVMTSIRLAADLSIPPWQNWLETGLNLFAGSFVPMLFLYMLLVGIVFLPLLNLRAARERGALICSALTVLSHMGDKRLLPLVLDLAVGTRAIPAQAARAALLPLLSHFESADAERLTPRTRLQLAQALGTAEIALDRVLLNALELAGTGPCVPYVKRLAQQTPDAALRTQATYLLRVLTERQQNEAAGSVLLRASQARSLPQEELLRAGGQPTWQLTEQLLHPVTVRNRV